MYMQELLMSYAIGVVGLGVMGHNLALNMERNGFAVAGYDLDAKKTEAFLHGAAAGKNIIGVDSPAKLMAVLDNPRRILMMVPAGTPVDSAIALLKPHLEKGDILIDGGNSYFLDTERRNLELEEEGFNFMGVGVSGGEEGALWGPSIMPGGQPDAWQRMAPVLRAMAAKAEDGAPCVEYMGPRGAGHYVKMVHNGIEYADMQLIAESYDVLRRLGGLTALQISELFKEWNNGELRSYLVEITANILTRADPESGKPLVDMILDEAQQKGTGKWTSQNSFDTGAPIPTINAAVESRILSSLKSQRVTASKVIHGPRVEFSGEIQTLIDAARQALYASKVTSYAQGMGMLALASAEYKYDLNLRDIARIWRAGCIIRADLLNGIMAAYERDAGLQNLLLDPALQSAVEGRQAGWRYFIQCAVGAGIPVLATGASLAYFDAYRSETLPANLIQAQRDYFGAHTYRRIDREGIFHTEWNK
jgi:6-phosphogluconate dehydrogenase